MAYEEEFIVASAVDWFANELSGPDSGDVNLNEEHFDFEAATEAVEFNLLLGNDRAARDTGKKFNDVVAMAHCYAKSETNMYRVDELSDLVHDLLLHADIPIYDMDESGKPIVGFIRLQEPNVVDLTEEFNKVHEISGKHISITVAGIAQEI